MGEDSYAKWLGDESLPNEEWLKSHWEREIEERKAEGIAEEQVRQSNAGQRAEELLQQLHQAAGYSEADIEDLRDELANQQRHLSEAVQEELDEPTEMADVASLQELLGDPLPTEDIATVGWLSPDDSSVAVATEGSEAPWHRIQIEEDQTVVRGLVSARGKRNTNEDWATLTVWLYYSLQPPKSGVLTVRAFPTLHGRYRLSAYDFFPANATARITADYLWAATQKGKQTGIIRQRFLDVTKRSGATDRSHDRIRDPVHTTLLVAGDEPVYLQFGIKLYASGVSGDGNAWIDFYVNELDHRITVPPLYWILDPF